ncbi:MAG TPA: hypothetical protein VM597_01070 [Gemmataceae bacterium]|nr:hypothetical protein [Gemmataceae bacterium]
MPSARRPARTRLTVTELGARVVPAVVLTTLDLDGDGAADDIRIVGDTQNTRVTLQDNGANTVTIAIDANGDGDLTDGGDSIGVPHNFQGDSVAFDINLGGGNDTVEYTTTGNYSASTRTLWVNLGGGNDKFQFTANAFDTLNASAIAFDLTGGGGNDTVGIQFDEVRKGLVAVTTDLGAGSDTYTSAFDRIDDGAAVTLRTELGAGPNVYTADFQEVGFGDRGSVDLDVVGGAQVDTVQLNMHDDIGNGTKASRFSAAVDLLGGNDVYKALFDRAGNVFRVDDHSQAAFAVRGGAGDDALTAAQTGAAGTIRIDPDALLSLDLAGGLGNDQLVTDFGATDTFELIGALRVRMDGGLGADALTCLLANEADTTGDYDVALRAGAGKDTMAFSLVNNAGTPTLGPTGKALLDGGLGTDTLTNAAKALSVGIGFEVVV